MTSPIGAAYPLDPWGLPRPDVTGMLAPVECKHCGCVHDSGPVEVIARYADCSVWRCPGCRVAVDDRDPRWGGGVYQLDREGNRR